MSFYLFIYLELETIAWTEYTLSRSLSPDILSCKYLCWAPTNEIDCTQNFPALVYLFDLLKQHS